MNLDGVFGMVEMEEAANRIIELCQATGTWSTPIRYVDMGVDGEPRVESRRSGFLQLIYNGWMVTLVEKAFFYPGENFVKRIGNRVDLPGKGTLDDLIAVRYPWLSKIEKENK